MPSDWPSCIASNFFFNEKLGKWIPEGWEVIPIKDFCKEMKNGATPSRDNLDYWISKDIPWIKTGEVSNNILLDAEELNNDSYVHGEQLTLLIQVPCR